MITDKNILEAESAYLEKVTDEIRNQLDAGVNAAGKFKKDAIELQKDMWEEVKCRPTDLSDLDAPAMSWQYQADIANQARKYRFSYDTVLRLEKMLKNPYFGRIDFIEDGEDEAEKIYIGLGNLYSGSNTSILVYDWRAPISSMFYDHETGPCSYMSPMGAIHGRMLLKRQYKIENQRIVFMFESDVRINDEMLQEILGKSTDSRMRTIVTSIQKEQNRVIRDDRTRILIVQGPAGSGKTSIALHRAAYLLYRYRESIKSENILIFSPNHVFEDYISNVLPQLGEENIRRSTFADFFKGLAGHGCHLETMNRHMEYILSGDPSPVRLTSIKLKASSFFPDIIGRYAGYLERGENIEFRSLSHGGRIIVPAEEIRRLFAQDYSYLPYIKRLSKLKQRLLYLVEPYVEARAEELLTGYLAEDISLDGKEKKIVAAMRSKDEFEQVMNDIERMTDFDIVSLYAGMFRNIRSFAGSDILSGPGFSPDYLDIAASYTVRWLENRVINYEDLAPVILLMISLGADSDAKAVKHVIIDEAQDYTPVQYEIIKRVFGHSNMTILGDINQSINAYMNIGSFEAAADIFGAKDTTVISLTKSYRSTKAIADFCNALLLSDNAAEQLDRSGNKPLVIKSEKDELFSRIADDIKGLKGEGHKLIAVICKNVKQCETYYEGIIKFTDISLITDHNEEYQGGTIVIPSYLAKGLEFDAVIVCTTDARKYSGEEDRRLLYTVCSRALHELHLYYCEELTHFIKEMKTDLYKLSQ
jgi:DNA helicase-2/ATP-dependent DNA helicase PcrA